MLDLVMALRVVYFGRGFESLKCSLFHFCVFGGLCKPYPCAAPLPQVFSFTSLAFIVSLFV